MENVFAVVFGLLVAALLYPLGRQRYRQWQSAKKADALLSDVLRSKDALRR